MPGSGPILSDLAFRKTVEPGVLKTKRKRFVAVVGSQWDLVYLMHLYPTPNFLRKNCVTRVIDPDEALPNSPRVCAVASSHAPVSQAARSAMKLRVTLSEKIRMINTGKPASAGV